MEAVVRLVSELFMIVLCLYVSPADQKEIRIDVVGDQGYVDTLVLRREADKSTKYIDIRSLDVCTHPEGTEEGWAVYEGLSRYGTIRPVKGKEHVYVCTHAKRKPNKEIVDLSQSIVDFESLDLRKAEVKTMKLKDGSEIRFNRSGSVVYLKPAEEKRTYVVH